MIRLDNVTKAFRNNTVVDGISMTVNKGELVAIIGPSGCGKTTTLKMINGLEKITSGEIFVGEESVKQADLISLRRRMGYVIQQTGLFPHMTIKENIEIIPRLVKLPKEKIESRTLELMRLIGLEPSDFLWRYPPQLSGGQLQRIGVARSFAMDPEVILMDEPFSALDPVSREQLQDELIQLQAKLHKTILFVTHDMDEAIKLADRICIMNDGKIVQYATPEEILKRPADKFVEGFVGANRIWSSPELIKAKDIMITNPITVNERMSLVKAVELMRFKHVDSLLVTDEQKHLLGVVRPRHIRVAGDLSLSVGQVMVAIEQKALPQDNLLTLLEKFSGKGKMTIAVTDEQNILKGIITKSSLVTALGSRFIDMDRWEDEQ